jgi:CHASE1-domain containing sensor protein
MKRPSTNTSLGVTTDDPTDKSEGTDSHIFRPQRHDLVPVILAVIAIVLGLGAALTSFFLLQRDELQSAKSNLDSTKVDAIQAYSTALTSIVNVVQTGAAFFQLSKTDVTLYDQFEPFMYVSGQFPQYLTSISYSVLVPTEETDTFAANMRALGGAYANFTVTGRDDNNKVIPIFYTGPTRAIVTQVVPTSSMKTVLGYDRTTDFGKNETMFRAILTKTATASGRSTLAGRTDNEIGSFIMVGVYNRTTGAPQAVVTGAILFGQLTQATLQGITKNVIVSISDMNATSSDQYQGFVYSTANNGTNTVDQNSAMLAYAPFVSVANVPFQDRVLQVTLIPTDDYINTHRSSNKWIALAVSLCLMVILLIGCVILYFTRKLFLSRESRKRAHIQIDLLKTNQSALRILLDRIASQEQKTR